MGVCSSREKKLKVISKPEDPEVTDVEVMRIVDQILKKFSSDQEKKYLKFADFKKFAKQLPNCELFENNIEKFFFRINNDNDKTPKLDKI